MKMMLTKALTTMLIIVGLMLPPFFGALGAVVFMEWPHLHSRFCEGEAP